MFDKSRDYVKILRYREKKTQKNIQKQAKENHLSVFSQDIYFCQVNICRTYNLIIEME